MNILMVCQTTDDGGIETLIYRMAKWYVNNGYRVSILSTKKGNMHSLLVEAGCNIIYDHKVVGSFSPEASIESKINNYTKSLLYGPVKSVIGFCAISSYIALGLAIRLRTKCIAGIFHPFGYTSDNNRTTYKQLLKGFCERNALYSMNEPCLSSHEKYHSIKLKATLIPLPIASGDYLYRPDNSNCRVFSIGRLADFKTYNLYMLDVVKALLPQLPQLRYTIYGDGPLEPVVRKKIDSLGLGGIVRIIPSIEYDRIPNVIPIYDIHVGMGTSSLDTARFGMPSLIAPPFVSDPITNGFLYEVPPFSLGEVAGERGYISMEKELSTFFRSMDRENCANRCRDYVSRHYSLDNTILKIETLIRNSKAPTFSDLPHWSPTHISKFPPIYASLSARYPSLRRTSKSIEKFLGK